MQGLTRERMTTRWWAVVLAMIFGLALAGVALLPSSPAGAAHAGEAAGLLTIDYDPATPGIQNTIDVGPTDPFDVDIFVEGAVNLIGFNINVTYVPADFELVAIGQASAGLLGNGGANFLFGTRGTNLDVAPAPGDPIDTDGVFQVTDLVTIGAPVSGDGLLTRLTFMPVQGNTTSDIDLGPSPIGEFLIGGSIGDAESFAPTVTDNDNPGVVVGFDNVAPVADNDAATVDQDSVNNSIDVLTGDTDADGNLDPASVSVGALSTQGGATTFDLNTETVRYSPAAAFVGEDTFTYTVDDDLGLTSNVATVTITVTDTTGPVIVPPADIVVVANAMNADPAEIADDAAVSADGRTVAQFLAGASVTDNLDTGLTAPGMPASPFTVGDHTITFDVSDAAGNAATQVTATLTVLPLADPGGPDGEADSDGDTFSNRREVVLGTNPLSACGNTGGEFPPDVTGSMSVGVLDLNEFIPHLNATADGNFGDYEVRLDLNIDLDNPLAGGIGIGDMLIVSNFLNTSCTPTP